MNVELREEIALMRGLSEQALKYAQNPNFTATHRADCRREHFIFWRVLRRLEGIDSLLTPLETLERKSATASAAQDDMNDYHGREPDGDVQQKT